MKAKLLNYLHTILTNPKDGMLYKVFMTQWFIPTKGDWIIQIKKDLQDFDISEDFELIASKSKLAYKASIKAKAKVYAIKILNMNKSRYKKLDKLEYVELKTRNYLIAKNLNLDQKRLIFKYRTRMADYGENFRAGREMVICPLCKIHLDSQFLGATAPLR